MEESCEWPVQYVPPCAEIEEMDPDLRALIEQMAIDYLWNWTGKVFGVCEDTVRPCREDCAGGKQWASTFWGRGPGYDPGFPRLGGFSYGWHPVLVGGEWHNIGCGDCGTSSCKCGLDGPETLRLPGPIHEVSEVLIDGVILPAASYTVMYDRLVVRTDGGVWPTCQNLSLPSTEPDTWSVTYTHGVTVPVGGQVAAGALACEMAKAAMNDAACALPKRLQTVTRQGVTVGVFDNFDATKDSGATGVWLIDSWVASVSRPKPYASVRSVDVKPRVH